MVYENLEDRMPAAEKTGDLSNLSALGRNLQSLSDRRAVGETLLAHIIPYHGFDRGVIRLEGMSGRPQIEIARTLRGSGAENVIDEAIYRRVKKERRAILSPQNDRQENASDPSPTIGLTFCLPLESRNHLLGVLYLESGCSDPPQPHHLEWVGAAAFMASLALDNSQLSGHGRYEKSRLSDSKGEIPWVGESEALKRTETLLARVAPTGSTVLLRGESGTGKELAALTIHQKSQRSNGPLVAINCASLSETLLESELFGHERGSFTGAVRTRAGKIEAANNGTLFLDEVGEIPAGLQARLLRALEHRSFERVGGTRLIEVDFRLVAATNRDLEAAVESGQFRRDLFYRLNVITVSLPPLRQRRGDVELLARHFSRRFSRRVGRQVSGPNAEALAFLNSYPWPGNVRQLSNVVERAVVLGESELIRPEDLPEDVRGGGVLGGVPLGAYQATLEATKRALIRRAVLNKKGNLPLAAEELGLHLNSLHRLIRNLGLRSELSFN